MRAHINITKDPAFPTLVDLHVTCPKCKKVMVIEKVELAKLRAWDEGELIQHVFPTWTLEERELLISGYCGGCWDELFADDEEPSGPSEPDWDEKSELLYDWPDESA